MKRILLIAGLVLTIATSVVSGTLAAYNLSLDPFTEDTVVAKAFVLTGEKTSDTLENGAQKIAPGEKKEIRFSVSNKDGLIVTETDMDVLIDVAVTVTGKDISPLSYTLYDADGYDPTAAANVFLDGSTADSKSFQYDGLSFTAGEGATKNYVLVIDWPIGTFDNGDTALQGNDFSNSVQITVSGFQVK